MNKRLRHTITLLTHPLKFIVFLVVILLFAIPAISQNVKGDKPATNPSGPFLRIPKKLFRSKGADRPNTRDISGRKRIRTKNTSSANKGIYLSSGPYKDRKQKKPGDRPTQARARTFSKPPRNGQQAWQGTLQGAPLRVRSVSAQRARNNVYPQSGPYVNNSSKRPEQHTRPITRTASGKRVKKRSASQSFVVRGKKDVYWGKFSKGEKGITKDLTGRTLRTRNFKSPGIGVGTSDTLKFAHLKPGRERANSGKFAGGFISASRHRERPWTRDVSGHKLRLRTPKKGKDTKVWLLGAALGTRPKSKKSNRPLPVRVPGIGAGGIAKSLSKVTGRRRPKGGGSIKGKRNNNGQPINVRAPGGGAVGIGNFKGNFKRGELSPGFSPQGAGFSGSFKTRRPLKGGGSISGRVWNNHQGPIDVKTGAAGSGRLATFQGNFRQGELSPGIGRQGYGFSGNMKARRPPKGGGSVTGKFLRNNRQPVPVKGGAPGFDRLAHFQGNFRRWELQTEFGKQGYGFAGYLRTRKPAKGGGSISGKYLNNDGKPVNVKTGAPGFDRAAHFQGTFRKGDLVTGFSRQGYGYSGDIKAKKPAKGGGSISGKVWNNDGKAIVGRLPGASEAKAAKYKGGIALPWLKKIYIQNPKAFNKSLKKKKPKPNTYLASGLQVKDKQEKYEKKPHASRNALLGIGPKQGTVKASEYAHAMKMYWSYKHNPKSNDNAMKGIRPPKDLHRVVEFSGNSRLAKARKHNPSTHKDAMKVLLPGKAYARINDFAGNSKMKKYNDNRLHPDAQFAHGFRDNVKQERTLLMNFKLFWAKLFRKNDNQPGIVKEKEHRPRYDKKERDLWKALYD